MRLRTSFVIAAALAVGLAGWLLSGQIGGRDAGAVDEAATGTPESPEETPKISVRVQDLVAEPIEREVVANGETAPERSISLRAETSGRVVEIGGEEGERVERSALLVRLDPRDREVALLEANAYLRQRRIELAAARKLGEKGFQAETTVARAEADFATAEAALKRAELELAHSRIEAPASATLDRRHVEEGDFVDIGDPIATLLDQDPMLVTGEVSETEVGRLRPGMAGSVRLATGETLDARLRYVASRADQQTRTFEVELELSNPGRPIAAGISAEISIAVESVPAHKVSPSVLVLSDAGRLGVKTVGDNDAVLFMPVEIVRADEHHVWLAGLPAEVRLITVGQGFVSDGADVVPVPVEGEEGQGASGQVVSEAAR